VYLLDVFLLVSNLSHAHNHGHGHFGREVTEVVGDTALSGKEPKSSQNQEPSFSFEDGDQ
jgi:hypothetical protein